MYKIPKLRGVLRLILWKTGQLTNIKNVHQISSKPIAFQQNMPKKFRQNVFFFCEFVSENPPKTDFFFFLELISSHALCYENCNLFLSRVMLADITHGLGKAFNVRKTNKLHPVFFFNSSMNKTENILTKVGANHTLALVLICS